MLEANFDQATSKARTKVLHIDSCCGIASHSVEMSDQVTPQPCDIVSLAGRIVERVTL